MDQTVLQANFDNNSGVMYKLGSIEAQLKAMNDKLDRKEEDQDSEIKSLKSRVSQIEKWRNMQLGGAAVIAFVVGLLQKVVPWSNLF